MGDLSGEAQRVRADKIEVGDLLVCDGGRSTQKVVDVGSIPPDTIVLTTEEGETIKGGRTWSTLVIRKARD